MNANTWIIALLIISALYKVYKMYDVVHEEIERQKKDTESGGASE